MGGLMLLPYRMKNPPESLPIATCVLMFANVAAFAITCDGWAIKDKFLQSGGIKSSNFNFLNMNTSMFLHADWIHLLGNMLFLYLFGFAVEGRLRTIKFLILYFAAGYAGDLAFHVFLGARFPNVPGIGASGAIMGLVGAALYTFPFAKVPVVYWFGWFWRGVTDWPLWGVALYFLGFDLINALLVSSLGGGGVNNFAHLGGAAGGFVIAAMYRVRRDKAEASEAKAILAEMKDYRHLSSRALHDLHIAQPSNPEIVLHWMHNAMRENRVGPEVKSAFAVAMPSLFAEPANLRTTASAALMGGAPDDWDPAVLMDMAARLEKDLDPQQSIAAYERAFNHPRATDDHRALGLFRVGVICQTIHPNPGRAAQCFKFLAENYPQSRYALQARARMAPAPVQS